MCVDELFWFQMTFVNYAVLGSGLDDWLWQYESLLEEEHGG